MHSLTARGRLSRLALGSAALLCKELVRFRSETEKEPGVRATRAPSENTDRTAATLEGVTLQQ